jgi:hypothetical protein
MNDAELIKGTLACVCIGLAVFNLVIQILTIIFMEKIFKHYTTFAFVMLCSFLFNLFLLLSYKFLSITPWSTMNFIGLIINCIIICLCTLTIAVSDKIMLKEDN